MDCKKPLMPLKSPEEIVTRLKKLARKIEGHFESLIHEVGITHAQFRVIFPIVRDGKGYSMQELSDTVGVDKGLVSRTVADLEAKGIVVRDKEEDSRERNYKIMLSEKGMQMVRESIEPKRKEVKEWLAGFSPGELLGFEKTLFKLTDK